MKTIDLERLYERGSPAQKLWAVVLLLSVKDGATRVWYDPAQGDRQLGYEIDGVQYSMAPPPALLRATLLQVMEKLLRWRSVRRLIFWLFGGSTSRSARLEGTFVAKVGGEGVTVSAIVDVPQSRVVLRLPRDPSAGRAAQVALERVFRNSPLESLRELPEEDLQ